MGFLAMVAIIIDGGFIVFVSKGYDALMFQKMAQNLRDLPSAMTLSSASSGLLP